jgi:hypothetical protein
LPGAVNMRAPPGAVARKINYAWAGVVARHAKSQWAGIVSLCHPAYCNLCTLPFYFIDASSERPGRTTFVSSVEPLGFDFCLTLLGLSTGTRRGVLPVEDSGLTDFALVENQHLGTTHLDKQAKKIEPPKQTSTHVLI